LAKKYRGIDDTNSVNFWYRDTSWCRQYWDRPALHFSP